MPRSALVCFLLLNCAALAPAADFRLGLDHTQWGPAIAANEQIAADNAGALYILDISASSLTKLAADGTTILWQQNLASPVSAMAVDPNGGVYLIADATVPSAVVEKLSANSATVMWKTAIEGSVSLAVDDSGRAFVATNEYHAGLPSHCRWAGRGRICPESGGHDLHPDPERRVPAVLYRAA